MAAAFAGAGNRLTRYVISARVRRGKLITKMSARQLLWMWSEQMDRISSGFAGVFG